MEYYKEVVKLASQLGDKERKINAYLGLGNAFIYAGEFERSRKYFLKAVITAEQINNKPFQKEAHTNLGYVYYKSCKFDAAERRGQRLSHAR
jgi:tetratricopeptide (TPR) repeat protein